MASPVADVYTAPSGATLYAGRAAGGGATYAAAVSEAVAPSDSAFSGTGTLTPFRNARTDQRYATLAQAVAGSISGDTITVSPGTYTIPAGPGEQTTPGNTWISGGINLNTLTIEWEVPGTRPVIDLTAFATAQASGGQPIGIHGGFNNRHLTVRGLELIGYPGGDSYGIYLSAGYPSGNPAASLTVEYCKLTRWADGVKTTYANTSIDCDIRYSVFQDCTADGQTHGVYVQGDTLNVIGCDFSTTVAGLFPTPSSAGHAVKSRMKVTNVLGCFFDMAGGVAALVETPGGGQVTVAGNIMFAYNVGDPSNPPIKYGFEEVARQITVTLLAGAISVGDVLTGLTDQGVKSATVRVVKGGGTTLVYDVGSTGRFAVGATLTIAGVNRATVLTSTGSPDGDSNDGRTHSLLVGQNTVWKEQPSAWAGTTMTAIGAVWVHTGMTDNQGDAITVTPTVRNNIIINNPGSATGCGARTLVDYPDNSAVASTTINSSGVYSGTPIPGSPAVNDAPFEYAGQFTPPLTRTDTFRGGLRTGRPAWRTAMTVVGRIYALTPTATIGSLDPRNDGALNPNGAGNTPPWHAAGNTQATGITAWCGGSFNQITKILAVGLLGGHSGYSGNELYSILLSADAPTYVRRCPPSGSTARPATFTGGYPNSGTNDDVGTDERPKATHSYGNPVQDDLGRIFQMPGGAANTNGIGNTWTSRVFRFVGSDWDLTGPSETTRPFSGPGAAVYDSASGVIWHIWGATTFQYDPETGAPTVRTTTDGALYYGTAAIANGYVMALNAGGGGSDFLRLFVFAKAAPGTYRYHQASASTGQQVAWAGTAPPYVSGKYYSIAWDSIRGRLLVYNGGTRLFTLTPPGSGSWVTGTWTWSEIALDSSVHAPSTDAGNGIFGRFFYDAEYDCAMCQPSDVTAPLTVIPLGV